MSLLELAETNDWFFDLDFVRSEYPEAQELSDKAIIRKILDPENSSVFDPNLLFDGHFYRRITSAEVSFKNPVAHFLSKGIDQGYSPNHCFDTLYYLKNLPSSPLSLRAAFKDAVARLKTGSILPAFHPFISEEYLRLQNELGKSSDFYRQLFRGNFFSPNPHPLFDINYFGQLVQKQFESFADAFNHYWQSEEDLSTHALFESEFYRSQLPGADRIRRAVYHYLVSDEPHSPQPLFDSAFYISTARTTLGETPKRPFEHFLTKGQLAGLAPSPFFDADYYRQQTHCGPNALQHYLEGGHRSAEAHPMVSFTEARMLSYAAHDPERSTLSRLIEWPDELPLNITPEFDPTYWKRKLRKVLPAENSKIQLRNHYLRFGYPSGLRPNWLISERYIALQARIKNEKDENLIQHYFRNGWHRRPRVIIALQSFEDTPSNRTWLEILSGQTPATAIEIIVVTQSPGPLSTEFCQYAHVWQVAKPAENDPAGTQLKLSIARLHETLRANPPDIIFAEWESGSSLAGMFNQFDAPKVLFGGSTLELATEEDAEQISAAANLVWSLSGAVSNHLARLFDASSIHILGGYRPGPHSRSQTRHRLGIGSNAMLVVGSGPLDIASGVDLFGAIAAKYFTTPTPEPDVYFAWQGSGPIHPNTPAFYARYTVDIAAGPGKLHILTDVDRQNVLAAADIYLDVGRHRVESDACDDIRTMDLPIIQMSDTPDDDSLTFSPYDLEGAVTTLAQLIGNLKQQHLFSQQTPADTTHQSELTEFVNSFNECTRTLDVNLAFIEAASTPKHQNLLVLLNNSRLNRIRETEPMKRYISLPHSVRLSQSHLQHVDIPEGSKNLLDAENSCDLVFCTPEHAIRNAESIGNFDRVLWLLESGDAALEEISRLGHICNQIAVDNPELISSMETLNPGVAALMTYDHGEIPCSEAS